MANVFDLVKGDAHVVAESSRLKATTAGHIYDLEMIEDTDNGSIVAVGALSDLGVQVFKAKEYATGDKPYFILTPPLAYNGKKAWSDEKYFYNAKGQLEKEVVYNERNKPSKVRKFEYDSNGVCTRRLNYGANGILNSYRQFEYSFE